MIIKKKIAAVLAALTIGACMTGCGDRAPETTLEKDEAKACAQNLAGTWKTSNATFGKSSTEIVASVSSNGNTYVDLTEVWMGAGVGWASHDGARVEEFNYNKNGSGNNYYKGKIAYETESGVEVGQYFYSNSKCNRLTICTVIYKKQ